MAQAMAEPPWSRNDTAGEASKVLAFVEYLVCQLVDDPESVNVRMVSGVRTNVYEVRVAKGELGKVIGRNGQTARSLRTLLNAVAAKNQIRAVLEILE
jgi:uncharacterized protein